jgi:hypothetical protein
MASEESSLRWRELVEVRDDFDSREVVLPKLTSRIDGRPLRPSPEAIHFAEALSVSASWSRISEARERRMAA